MKAPTSNLRIGQRVRSADTGEEGRITSKRWEVVVVELADGRKITWNHKFLEVVP
jgi:hypothetical protein